MSDIYSKIDRLYSDLDQSNRPQWVDELKDELKQIKSLLQNLSTSTTNPTPSRSKSREYFRFVQTLRERLRADTTQDVYPELHYQNKRIGVNFKGLLYDKLTSKIVPKVEAFEIYDYFYSKKDKIETLIMVN